MSETLEQIVAEYRRLRIPDQLDYGRLYLYLVITHSTAIEGSTVTEIENQLLFDEGISPDKPIGEQLMNLDLKRAYEQAYSAVEEHERITPELLRSLSGSVMRNTGGLYNTMVGSFDSAEGDYRLLNISAGRGGKSYLSWQKVEDAVESFCTWVEKTRKAMSGLSIGDAYRESFEAHYRLVQIHPWADGNGRMSRLVMNMLQVEAKLIPSIVKREARAAYIQSLADASDADDSECFQEFMLQHHRENLLQQIEDFKRTTRMDN